MVFRRNLGKTAAIIAVAVLGTFLVLLALIAIRFQPIDPHSPGGIARLQILAQTSRPLMAAVEHYHKEYGYYPAQFSDLGSAYDKTRNMGWYYEGWTVREAAQQYSLSILPGPGHDPILRFQHRTNGTCEWVYDPGDGSPETALPFSIGDKPGPKNGP